MTAFTQTETVGHYKGIKEFSNSFDSFARSAGYGKAFSDLLDVIIAIEQPRIKDDTNPLGSVSRYETMYMEAIKGYSKRELEYMAKAYANLYEMYTYRITADGGWGDPLGQFYQEIAGKGNKKFFGQFFTPEHLCDLCSIICLGDDLPKDRLSICDPACGSGRMFLSASRKHPVHQFNFYVGVDLDHVCCKMAAINMRYHGLKGVIVWGDTLAMKCFGGYHINSPIRGGFITKLSKEEAMSTLVATKNTIKAHDKPSDRIITYDSPITPKPNNKGLGGEQLRLF